MKNNSLIKIRQLYGVKLLEYILNEVRVCDKFSEDKFRKLSDMQKKTLSSLLKNMNTCIADGVKKSMHGRISLSDILLRNDAGTNIFNIYRKWNGGILPKSDSDDELFDYLFDILVDVYPNYLVSMSGNKNCGFGRYNLNNYYNTINRSLSKIIANDSIGKLLNNKSGLEQRLNIFLNDGSNYSVQVSLFPQTLIERSIQNAFNKMSYELDDVIIELRNNINLIRELAEGKEVDYSHFIGIKGLKLLNFNKYESENLIVRRFDSKYNPNKHTLQTISTQNENGESIIIGAVAEIPYTVKLVDEELYSKGSFIRENWDKSKEFVEQFKASVALAKGLNYGFSISFYETGFPLISVGNYSFNSDSYGSLVTITMSDSEEIDKWMNKLNRASEKKLDISISRLISSIFDRRNEKDAIIDAIISWEGLFSEAFETKLKVAGSISCLLSDNESRVEFYKKVSKLYDLRSAIVHGRKLKLPDHCDSINDAKIEVINIAINCLRIVLSNDELLEASSADRYKKILVYNNTNKFNINS